MSEEKVIQRRFSLEDDFMNFKTNDLLYGFMRGLSTARPVVENDQRTWQEYLPIKTFRQNKKLIAGICGVTLKTIDNQLNKLFEAGLLDQGIETVVSANGKPYNYDVYWFPYNENGKYKLIDQELVKYLVNTRNSQGIRIYLYLLNKFQWKKDYIFTIQEIKEALGYASTTKSCDELIRDCLASFKAESLIKFTVIEMPVETSKDLRGKTYRIRLDYVCNSSAELPQRNFK